MKHLPKLFSITTLIVIGSICQSNAAVILSPVGIVSVSGGTFNPTFAVSNLINGSVTSSFISGVTDFNTYTASSTSSTDNGIPWTAAAGNSTATITFDLGEQYKLTAMAIWNSPPGSYPGPGQGTKLLTVEIDDNLAFSSPLQVVTANLVAIPQLRVVGGFADVSNPSNPLITRYVRLNIFSTNSGSSPISLGEVAFRADAVPEPSALILLGCSLSSVAFIRRRRCEQD